MVRASHPLDRAGVEVFGPLDSRSIEAEDVHPISHEFTQYLRAVRPVQGHRAAVVASMAAILSGVVVLSDLGGDDAVVDVLRQHLSTAEQRIAERAAGARRNILN